MFPVSAIEEQELVQGPQDLLKQAVADYVGNKDRITSELVTAFWRTKLQVDGARVGLEIAVPDCNWTEEEIRRPMVDRKGKEVPGMMVYKPGEVTLPILGRMYRAMQNFSVAEDSPVTDTHDTAGWVKVEATIDAPNLGTTQKDLEKFAEKTGYLGQGEATYILASQASKDLSGQYFDQGSTWSRLLGSRGEGRVLCASFYSNGGLRVFWILGPQGRVSDLGGRSEEVKRA